MTQHYSNPERESDPQALPDVEVFYVTQADCDEDARQNPDTGADYTAPGWYWWTCSPGCLPDGEPNGPFDTEEEALADAQASDEPDDDCDPDPLPPCVLSMRCYCAGHARGNPASEACDTSEEQS